MGKKVNLDFMYLYPDIIDPIEIVAPKNKVPFEFRAYMEQQFNFFKRQLEQSQGKK